MRGTNPWHEFHVTLISKYVLNKTCLGRGVAWIPFASLRTVADSCEQNNETSCSNESSGYDSFCRRFGKNMMFPSSGGPNQFQVDVEVTERKSVDFIGRPQVMCPISPGIYLVQSKWADIPV